MHRSDICLNICSMNLVNWTDLEVSSTHQTQASTTSKQTNDWTRALANRANQILRKSSSWQVCSHTLTSHLPNPPIHCFAFPCGNHFLIFDFWLLLFLHSDSKTAMYLSSTFQTQSMTWHWDNFSLDSELLSVPRLLLILSQANIKALGDGLSNQSMSQSTNQL